MPEREYNTELPKIGTCGCGCCHDESAHDAHKKSDDHDHEHEHGGNKSALIQIGAAVVFGVLGFAAEHIFILQYFFRELGLTNFYIFM